MTNLAAALPLYPENALILAPLAGFTDAAYRRAARRCGCRFAFTEMVDAASLAYSSDHSSPLLYRPEDEDFLGTQLVGSDPELLKRACEALARHRFELLDFNLGCPVPKVVKKGAGAALGRNLDAALRCFAVLKEYSPFPLTAKLRILSDTDPEPTIALCRGLVELGARAITIHGRTMERFYSGAVAAGIIAAVREALPQTPVIANGGVDSPAACAELRRASGCSRIMLAQGAMGNPWLFREIAGGPPPTLDEWREMVYSHIDGMISLYGEAAAMKCARKIVHDYLRGRGFPSFLRAEASTLACRSDLDALLKKARPVSGTAPRALLAEVPPYRRGSGTDEYGEVRTGTEY